MRAPWLTLLLQPTTQPGSVSVCVLRVGRCFNFVSRRISPNLCIDSVFDGFNSWSDWGRTEYASICVWLRIFNIFLLLRTYQVYTVCSEIFLRSAWLYRLRDEHGGSSSDMAHPLKDMSIEMSAFDTHACATTANKRRQKNPCNNLSKAVSKLIIATYTTSRCLAVNAESKSTPTPFAADVPRGAITKVSTPTSQAATCPCPVFVLLAKTFKSAPTNSIGVLFPRLLIFTKLDGRTQLALLLKLPTRIYHQQQRNFCTYARIPHVIYW